MAFKYAPRMLALEKRNISCDRFSDMHKICLLKRMSLHRIIRDLPDNSPQLGCHTSRTAIRLKQKYLFTYVQYSCQEKQMF